MFKDNTIFLLFIIVVIIVALHRVLINNIVGDNLSLITEPGTESGIIISADPGIYADCYRNPNDKSVKAWTSKNSTQFPINHTSKVTDELTKTGDFFDENNCYGDITSPYSSKEIPDRCEIIDDEVFCKLNDRLQNIPIKLINNKKLLNAIGDDGDIFTNSSCST